MERRGVSQSEARAKSTSWAITYGDMVTLLLTFFILLLVIMNDAEKHIDRVINMLLDESFQELAENVTSSYVMVERVTKGVKITLASGRLFKSMDADVQTAVYPLLQQISGIIKLSRVVRVHDDPDLGKFLESVEKAGRELNIEIRCEGHTDDESLPAGAKYESNWDLSTARALNIVKLLSLFAEIPQEKFSAMGYGEFRPVVTNVDAVSRSKNRRVEIYLDAFITTPTVTN
ncbi:MAG: OmpA family protein [Candidatus Marinimicrobia bacterium]|nr:OmpA family protein [Candidatus Neomarinimicrobiota bacterium]